MAEPASDNILVNLKIEGEAHESLALVQEVQHDYLRGGILHIDFHAVAVDEDMHADVPIILSGVEAAEKKGGKIRGDLDNMEKKAAVLIAEAFEESFEKIKTVGGDVKPRLEIKAAANMTAASNLTGNVVATYELQTAVRGRRKINFRDLVPVINSATGVWKFYRENTPVGQGSLATQSTHASVKNQLDYALTEVTVTAD